MTDNDIARRLAQLEAVFTPVQRVRNDIIAITARAVIVCSERTDVQREIPFADIRNAEAVTRNGVIARALKAAVAGGGEDVRGRQRSLCWAPANPAPTSPRDRSAMIVWYRRARTWVDQNTDWVDSVKWTRDPAYLTEQEFLAEYSWAVYVSGFRAGTVSVKWKSLTTAWRGFSPHSIDASARAAAMKLIGHRSKTAAILRVAEEMRALGWATFRAKYLVDTETIGEMPWMGPANRRFLARNLRIADVGKPDRWLVRFAEAFGYDDVDDALAAVAAEVGDPAGLADAYIWAFLAENPHSLD